MTVDAPLSTLPLYVKAGAIVPMCPTLQHTGEFDRNMVTLRIYPGANGRFTWYDDDGISYRHEHGAFMRVECAWSDRSRELMLMVDSSGLMPLPSAVQVELVGSASGKRIALTGKNTTIKL